MAWPCLVALPIQILSWVGHLSKPDLDLTPLVPPFQQFLAEDILISLELSFALAQSNYMQFRKTFITFSHYARKCNTGDAFLQQHHIEDTSPSPFSSVVRSIITESISWLTDGSTFINYILAALHPALSIVCFEDGKVLVLFEHRKVSVLFEHRKVC